MRRCATVDATLVNGEVFSLGPPNGGGIFATTRSEFFLDGMSVSDVSATLNGGAFFGILNVLLTVRS